MPFAQVYVLEDTAADQRSALIEGVTQVMTRVLGAPQESVRVWVHDLPMPNWGSGASPAKEQGPLNPKEPR